jgi:Fur family ferric uptake transcriptional regulator
MATSLILLKQNGLSKTTGRMAILDLFLDAGQALSHAAIEEQLHQNFDRVTIYRTLQTFVEKGIVHQIPTTDNTILYALCKEQCQDGHHHDNHVHFICIKCDKTNCLEEVIVPLVKLPRGFQPVHAAMLVKGVCRDCRKSERE